MRNVEVVNRDGEWRVRIERDDNTYITEDLGTRELAVEHAEKQAAGQPIKVVHERAADLEMTTE